MKFKSLAALLSVFVFLFSAPAFSVNAAEPAVSGAQNMLLMNLDADCVLYKKYSGGKIAPGPAVKIMTGLIAAEKLKGRLDERVKITEKMLPGKIDGALMGLSAGDELTAGDLLYSTICGGYSDAAYALAAVVSGSAEKFVAAMNVKAGALYMEDTFLPIPRDLTTKKAYDNGGHGKACKSGCK